MSHCDGTGRLVQNPESAPVVQRKFHGTASSLPWPERYWTSVFCADAEIGDARINAAKNKKKWKHPTPKAFGVRRWMLDACSRFIGVGCFCMITLARQIPAELGWSHAGEVAEKMTEIKLAGKIQLAGHVFH